MRHIVMFSGGAASWLAAKRVVERHGVRDTILMFADTSMEDPDLYRFLDEAAADVGAQLVRLREGRTPWEVFRDERFLGNHRVDPCSRILKRELIRSWLERNYRPEGATVYLGYDWTEEHRFLRAIPYWRPYLVEAPLLDPPVMKEQAIEELERRGMTPPRLYQLGFPHNNCGGFCVKAGQAHFAHLLRTLPEAYKYHEEQEESLRLYLGKNISILDDRRGGVRRLLTLRQLRERLECGGEYNRDDWGGCGCMTPEETTP